MRVLAAVLITFVVFAPVGVRAQQDQRAPSRVIAIDPSPCSEAVPPDLDDAIDLELGGSEWATSESTVDAHVRLRIGVDACAATPSTLILSLHAPDGRGFHEVLDLSRYTGRERARAVAIWTAERLFALSSFLSASSPLAPAGAPSAQQPLILATQGGATQLSAPQPPPPATIIMLPQQQPQQPQVIIIDGSQQPLQSTSTTPLPPSSPVSTPAPSSQARDGSTPLRFRANALGGVRGYRESGIEPFGGLSLDVALPRPGPREIGLTFEVGLHYGVLENDRGMVNTWVFFASTFLGWTWDGFSLDLGARVHVNHGASGSSNVYLGLSGDAVGVSGALVARGRVRLGSSPLSVFAEAGVGAAISGVGSWSGSGAWDGITGAPTRYEKLYWGYLVSGIGGVSYDF